MGRWGSSEATDLHLRTAKEQYPLGTVIPNPDSRYSLTNSAWDAHWSPGEGGHPKGSRILENERLRATGLTSYIADCGYDGKMTTPLLFREATPEAALCWIRAPIYPVLDGTLLGVVPENSTERKALDDQLAPRAFHAP